MTDALLIFDFIVKYAIVPVIWLIWKIRTNDLKHVDKRLDDLHEWTRDLEHKLDEHIANHRNR